MAPDYYSVLGVEKDARPAQIKKAWAGHARAPVRGAPWQAYLQLVKQPGSSGAAAHGVKRMCQGCTRIATMGRRTSRGLIDGEGRFKRRGKVPTTLSSTCRRRTTPPGEPPRPSLSPYHPYYILLQYRLESSSRPFIV